MDLTFVAVDVGQHFSEEIDDPYGTPECTHTMTIHRTTSLIETYRAKAKASDINELTGRSGRADLTRFVIGQIVAKLPLLPNSIVVDVGCGDGLLLRIAAEAGVDRYVGRLIGILPTVEEIVRVRNHLLHPSASTHRMLSIEHGSADRTSMPDDFCDILVCNSVLHGGGQTRDDVDLALEEFARITKVGGTLFIGEMPEANELAGKNYGNSITKWLIWILWEQGFKAFVHQLKKTLIAVVGSEPFVISPKTMFHMQPQQFIALLRSHCIDVVEYFRHEEIDGRGSVFDSGTRWDYVCIKRDRSDAVQSALSAGTPQ